MSHAERQIAKLTVRARVELIPAVSGFVRETALKLAMPAADAEKLARAIEEACMKVIEHASDPGEDGTWDITILRRPRQVAVTVEDRGFSGFEKPGPAGESVPGMLPVEAFADEVHFLSPGRRGQRVEIVRNLPLWDTVPESSMPPATTTPVPSDAPVELRLMRPDEGLGLARLVYRCYGYGYSRDSIYSPETVREYLKSGLVISYVAVAPDGEIVGHVALVRDRPEDRVGEMGQAVVDPRYRGRGLLEKLSQCVVNKARQDGLAGAFAEAVTTHPYSQKSALSLGFRETGVLPGFLPAKTVSSGAADRGAPRRGSIILFYMAFNRRAGVPVYLPSHHEQMIRSIYENAGIKRNFSGAANSGAPPGLPPRSCLGVSIQPAAGRAGIRVLEYGADLETAVRSYRDRLCDRRIDCIYLDLPLENPAVRPSCAAMELLGFFFGGIVPETAAGDVLRLQYLNNVAVDPTDLQTASDFSRGLLDYVMKARQSQYEA